MKLHYWRGGVKIIYFIFVAWIPVSVFTVDSEGIVITYALYPSYCPSSLPYGPVELDKNQGFQIINMVNFKHDIPTFRLRDQCSSCF